MAKKKPKKKKNLLNKFERDILMLFNRTLVPLSTNAIAERLGISYTTAKKYLESLLKKNLITKYKD